MLDVSSCSTYVVVAVPEIAAPSDPHIHAYAGGGASPYAHCWLVPPEHALAPHPDRTVLLAVSTADNAILVYNVLVRMISK